MKTVLRLLPAVSIGALSSLLLLSVPAFAQTSSAPSLPPGAGAGPGQEDDRGNRPNFDPEEMRKRFSGMLKEQFQVESADEWAIIEERMRKVQELRAATGSGGMGALGALAGNRSRRQGNGDNAPGQGGAGGRRGGFMGMQSSPESEALATALKNNSSPADIQERLTRLRESRKANEAKLAQAQEDLRAVLNVRQEAVAVLMGLLP